MNEISRNSNIYYNMRAWGVVGSSERKSLGNVPKQPTRNEGAEGGGLGGDKDKKGIFGKDWSHGKVGADWDTSFLFSAASFHFSVGKISLWAQAAF